MWKVSLNGMVSDNMATLPFMQERRAYVLPLWQLMMLVVNMLRRTDGMPNSYSLSS